MLFFIECIAGFHGENCSFTCGKCLNSTACHHITGSCDQGCDPGFEGLTCKKGTLFINMPLNWDFILRFIEFNVNSVCPIKRVWKNQF